MAKPTALPIAAMLLIGTVSQGHSAESNPQKDESLQQAAATLDKELRDNVLPWWQLTVDKQYGGYCLQDDSKQLVSQARMVWGFSHAHRHGYSSPGHDYLAAARQGYEFLLEHFHDKQHGGYYWMTDNEGTATNKYKMIYGQAFVMYAFVEYYRASRDEQALNKALEQFLVLQEHAHDNRHGGWFEHFAPDWTPVMHDHPQVSVEVPGCKSANSHLHLMESFTELYMESHNPRVRRALSECLQINQSYFYPADAAKSTFHCNPDWSRVTAKRSEGLSYGHNVEFAWLMLRAQDALHVARSWDHFYAHLDHALRYGYDHGGGGLYNLGRENEPAHDRGKVWWSQAELLAALTVSVKHRQRKSDRQALHSLLDFLRTKMIDSHDGIWAPSVSASGRTNWQGKKGHWKANYHDLRAIVMFNELY